MITTRFVSFLGLIPKRFSDILPIIYLNMNKLKNTNSSPKHILVLFAGLLLMTFGCEGPEGPRGSTGPAGPQGAAGVQGAAGNKGPDGVQGVLGTDNVFFSNWITNTWTRAANNFVGDTLAVPQITDDIINKGVVVAYFRDNSSTTSTKVYPAQIYQAGTNIWMFTLESKATKERLILFHGPSRVAGSDATNIVPFSQVRYMVIPGVSRAGRTNLPDFDDYEEVCAFFGVTP
jgi:hypothetical protein